jgi:molybdopterin-guanine dinucleotide biosynthesis protein A
MILGSLILAGGRSRRMGQPKESLTLGSNTLLGHTVDILVQCTSPVVVVARDHNQDLPPLHPKARITFDSELDKGPMLGLLAGLKEVQADCDAVFVTGCDTPFLSPQAIDWMASQLGNHDVVMPEVDDRLQPLSAIYRTRVLPSVRALIAEDIRTPRSLASRCNTRILSSAEIDVFDPQRKFLQNINNPDDYQAALRQFNGGNEV